MRKILIVGAGGQGAPCASILARDKDVAKIVIGDIDIGLANKVKDKVKSDKISAVKVDAGKIEDVERAAKGMDVIINLTLLRFNSNIMNAAVSSGAHYVDSAFGEPIGNWIIKKQPFEIDDEFKKAGLTALIGCGGSPGITNVLTRYVCDKLDHIDGIHIRVGDKLLEKPRDMVRTWEPTWSPEIALADYASESMAFENGEYRICPPFSGGEEYDFPPPVGPVVVCHHAHEEPITLPHFIGKGLRNVDFKYAVDPTAGSLVKMGFASSKSMDVKGVKVTPVDVLMKLVHRPVDIFFTEDETSASTPPKSIHPYLVEVEGEKSGENLRYKIWWPSSLFTTAAEKLELYRKFGTTKISVALPAIAGAKMCMQSEADRGVIPPECLDPVKFLKAMAEIGWPVKFHEVLSKEVAIL